MVADVKGLTNNGSNDEKILKVSFLQQDQSYSRMYEIYLKK